MNEIFDPDAGKRSSRHGFDFIDFQEWKMENKWNGMKCEIIGNIERCVKWIGTKWETLEICESYKYKCQKVIIAVRVTNAFETTTGVQEGCDFISTVK